jgi:hypothetical protein
MKLYVDTPDGTKMHGELRPAKGAEGRCTIFYREVNHEKDRMRVLDAWTIHPSALKQIVAAGVQALYYKSSNGVNYVISLSKALRVGFEKEFGGGKGFYIPLKHWEQTDAKN